MNIMDEHTTRSRNAVKGRLAKLLAVALLSAAAGVLLFELVSNVAGARADDSVRAGRNVFAVAGKITSDTNGIYLVDLENATICVYQYVPGSRRLRLVAARTFAYDCQLDAYSTEPAPAEIKKLVQEQRRLTGSGAGK